jgi:hypothetical protein
MLEMIETEAKDIGKMYDKRILMESNQTRMNELQHRFNDLVLRIGGPVLDMVENFARLALKILPDVNNELGRTPDQIGAISAAWSVLGAVIIGVAAWKAGAMIAAGFVGAKVVLASIATVAASISVFLVKIALAIKAGALAILSIPTLLKLAVAIAGFAIGNLIYESFTESLDLAVEWMTEKWDMICDDMIDGLSSVAEDMMSAMAYPFEWFWSWVNNLGILGKSPSDLGLAIVNGISSVGTMLFDALTFPFKSSWTFITNLFGKIPEFISSVFKRGIDFAMKLPGMGSLMKAMDKLSGSASTPTASADTVNAANSKDTDQLVLAKLTELVDLMRAGGIVINLDGRKVSEALAHASR